MAKKRRMKALSWEADNCWDYRSSGLRQARGDRSNFTAYFTVMFLFGGPPA